ncbi:MAG TPA: hypothetical protein VEV41_06245 [Terriglobales bacterium]|nr:hypothetical protein [Terriglobales bacterium]
MALTTTTNMATGLVLTPGSVGTANLPQKEPLGFNVPGGQQIFRARCIVTCDTSYPTGGYQLTAAMFGLNTLISVPVIESEVQAGVRWSSLDPVGSVGAKQWQGYVTSTNYLKLLARGNSVSGATEVANLTSVSSYTALLSVIGY